jgi:hypothetical protein
LVEHATEKALAIVPIFQAIRGGYLEAFLIRDDKFFRITPEKIRELPELLEKTPLNYLFVNEKKLNQAFKTMSDEFEAATGNKLSSMDAA